MSEESENPRRWEGPRPVGEVEFGTHVKVCRTGATGTVKERLVGPAVRMDWDEERFSDRLNIQTHVEHDPVDRSVDDVVGVLSELNDEMFDVQRRLGLITGALERAWGYVYYAISVLKERTDSDHDGDRDVACRYVQDALDQIEEIEDESDSTGRRIEKILGRLEEVAGD